MNQNFLTLEHPKTLCYYIAALTALSVLFLLAKRVFNFLKEPTNFLGFMRVILLQRNH